MPRLDLLAQNSNFKSKKALRLNSQHFAFFVTYEWAKYARVVLNIRLKMLATDKSSSSLGPFIRYEGNEGHNDVHFSITTNNVVYISQHFMYLVTYD